MYMNLLLSNKSLENIKLYGKLLVNFIYTNQNFGPHTILTFSPHHNKPFVR